MIQLFCGKPGGGKSYDVVRNRFIPAFKAGRKIYTNIEGLNIDYICAIEGIEEYYRDNIVYLVDFVPVGSVAVDSADGPFIAEYLPFLENMEPGAKKEKALKFFKSRKGLFRTPAGLLVCSVHEFYFFMSSGSLAIIDEVQNIWSAKDWSAVDLSVDYYLSKHRHYGHDVAFITQEIVGVYKGIQRLSEYVWYFEKMGWLGLPGRYKASCRLGVDDRRTFARHVRRYDKKYFSCYKSFTSSDIKEQKIESAKMYSPTKIGVIAVLLVFFLFKFINMPWFHGGKKRNNGEAVAAFVPSFKDKSDKAKGVSKAVVFEETTVKDKSKAVQTVKPKPKVKRQERVDIVPDSGPLIGSGVIVPVAPVSVVDSRPVSGFGCLDGVCYKLVNGEVIEYREGG